MPVFFWINILMKDLRQYIKLLPSQENIPCCTASATLTAIEILLSVNSVYINFSRLFLYYNTRKIQGRLGFKGAELKSTMKALDEFGCCKEITWPLNFHRIEKEPAMKAYNEAENFKGLIYTELSDINFKKYLDMNIPVVIGMYIGRKFLKLAGSIHEQQYYPVNNEDNRVSRGHALAIIGYDDNLCGGSWIVANSMGLRWGDKGIGIIPYSCNIDIGEAYSIESIAGYTTGKKISEN